MSLAGEQPAGVFVSYARADEAIARRVAARLEDAGHEVWWDQHLPAHQAYAEIIEQKLRAARAVVVLWSADAARSQWVRAEADVARAAGTLVQARVDDTVPPLPFNQIQCADLSGWRGAKTHRGWAKVRDSVAALIAGGPVPPDDSPPASTGKRRGMRRWAVAVALGLILAAALFVAWRSIVSRPDSGPPTIAVLPFKSLSPGDENLVFGIWEDTRQALSRNPQLRVIGRQSAEALAKQNLEPRQYRSKLDIDYLLDGNMRRAGERVRVSISLVRTSDGVEIWNDTLERSIDYMFKLQAEVAGEIEGRIRGRLATGGGIKADNIATSGAVYLLYSEARANLLKRGTNINIAHRQLKQAVEMDPNFAPAWASLAVAERLFAPTTREDVYKIKDPKLHGQAEAFARRAITLAPNLASGHAALGLSLGLQGPIAEAALRRAVDLDPNDVEALNWLASVTSRQGRQAETLKLYDRAVEIEPLWWPVVLNRLKRLLEKGDASAVDAEIARLERAGSEGLTNHAAMNVHAWRGDISEAVRRGLRFYKRGSRPEVDVIKYELWSLLLALGYGEEVDAIGNPPPFASYLRRNDPRGLDMVKALRLAPETFWRLGPLAENVARGSLVNGRAGELVALYRAVASSPQDLVTRTEDQIRFLHLAPMVSMALRQTGDAAEAERLIAVADDMLRSQSELQLARRDRQIYLARIRAVQGRLPEAAAATLEATRMGWFPRPPVFLADLQLDPPLGLLKDLPAFQQARARTLAHFARERAELGPVKF